jgi:hypothetical protein
MQLDARRAQAHHRPQFGIAYRERAMATTPSPTRCTMRTGTLDTTTTSTILTEARTTSPTSQRCLHSHPTAGRCQLVAAHPAPHALSDDTAHITWDLVHLHRWVKSPPPGWLIGLTWAAGYQPAVM